MNGAMLLAGYCVERIFIVSFERGLHPVTLERKFYR